MFLSLTFPLNFNIFVLLPNLYVIYGNYQGTYQGYLILSYKEYFKSFEKHHGGYRCIWDSKKVLNLRMMCKIEKKGEKL